MKPNRNKFTKTNSKPFSPTSYEYVFPLYGTEIQNGCKDLKQLVGTAFYIKNNLFITAYHVVQNCQEYSIMSIGFCNEKTPGCIELYDFEIYQIFNDIDIAIISIKEKCTFPKSFKWAIKNGLKLFQKVRSMGYPFGLNTVNNFTNWRAFEGNKVSDTSMARDSTELNCYEVSFHSPRGLSGAPLFDEYYRIHGIMLKNTISELEVYFIKDEEDGKEFRKTETTTLGMALHSRILLRKELDKMNNISILEYLKINNLLE